MSTNGSLLRGYFIKATSKKMFQVGIFCFMSAAVKRASRLRVLSINFKYTRCVFIIDTLSNFSSTFVVLPFCLQANLVQFNWMANL